MGVSISAFNIPLSRKTFGEDPVEEAILADATASPN